MNMIDINFNELKNINNDVKGWIKVNGTNINYPFVQSNNNKYYFRLLTIILLCQQPENTIIGVSYTKSIFKYINLQNTL